MTGHRVVYRVRLIGGCMSEICGVRPDAIGSGAIKMAPAVDARRRHEQ